MAGMLGAAALAAGAPATASAAPSAELRRYQMDRVAATAEMGDAAVMVSGYDLRTGPRSGEWDDVESSTELRVIQIACDEATDERVVRSFGITVAEPRFSVTPAAVALPDRGTVELAGKPWGIETRADHCAPVAHPHESWRSIDVPGEVRVRVDLEVGLPTSFDPAVEFLQPGLIGPSLRPLNDRCDLRAGPGVHGRRYASARFTIDGELPLMDGLALGDFEGVHERGIIWRFHGTYAQARGADAPAVCPGGEHARAGRKRARRAASVRRQTRRRRQV